MYTSRRDVLEFSLFVYYSYDKLIYLCQKCVSDTVDCGSVRVCSMSVDHNLGVFLAVVVGRLYGVRAGGKMLRVCGVLSCVQQEFDLKGNCFG